MLRFVALYRDRRAKGVTTRDLDAFLAFAPWRDKPAASRYLKAVLTEVIETAPQWLAIKAPTLEWFGFAVIASSDGDGDPWVPQMRGLYSHTPEGTQDFLMDAQALAYLYKLDELADPWGPQMWDTYPSHPSEGAPALLTSAEAVAYLHELDKQEELNRGT